MVKGSILLSSLFLYKEVLWMYKANVGEIVKWRLPQEPMYSYGIVLGIRGGCWVSIECRDYYAGMVVEVHKRYIRKVKKGSVRVGGGKEYSK